MKLNICFTAFLVLFEGTHTTWFAALGSHYLTPWTEQIFYEY